MPLSMKLWKVSENKLQELSSTKLGLEERLEDWIAAESSILGLDLLIIGRQVRTDFGGKIDLLALDEDGNIVTLELKRDKTPRDVVAQTLDYASWVKQLAPKDIEAIAKDYLKKDLALAFMESFGNSLPEQMNGGQRLIIVASQLDESSERIVQYLATEYRVNINAIYFSFFRDGDRDFLGRSWLMDPEVVDERADSRRPWSGYWFVNVGESRHRNWDDCREYGFLSAGQDRKYSDPLAKLKIGDRIFAYMKGLGYVGYGEVISEAIPVKEFEVKHLGKRLLELPLKQPNIKENADDPDRCEYVVGVKWIITVQREQARKFTGIFANQNIVSN